MKYINMSFYEEKLCNLNCVRFERFHKKNKRYVI